MFLQSTQLSFSAVNVYCVHVAKLGLHFPEILFLTQLAWVRRETVWDSESGNEAAIFFYAQLG